MVFPILALQKPLAHSNRISLCTDIAREKDCGFTPNLHFNLVFTKFNSTEFLHTRGYATTWREKGELVNIVEQLSLVIVLVCKVNWVTKSIAFEKCIRRFFKDDAIVEKQMIICGNYVNWVILNCALQVAQTGFSSPKLFGLWKVLTVLHSSYTEETLMKSTY